MKTNILNSIALKIFFKVTSQLNTYLIVMTIGVAFSYNTIYSQIIPSSCTAPVSVIDRYKIDATQIAIRKFFDQNLAYKDSIDVPNIHRDTILDALVAVYNIDTPERDSVVDLFDIHILLRDMGDIYAYIDTGTFSLTDPYLDSLMTKYNLIPEENLLGPFYVGFTVDKKYNQKALIGEVKKVLGVSNVSPRYYQLDGNNIETKIHDDHVELLYSHAWDLCPAACQYRRFWKFKVYYDCSVEFIESYGDKYFPPDELNVTNEGELDKLKVFPNPTTHQLNFTLKTNSNPIVLEIYDITGKAIKTKEYNNLGNEDFNGSIDVSALKNGLYFCEFNLENQQITRKFIKQ